MHGERALHVRFMFLWFQAFREQVILLASGGGQPNISQDKIRSIRVACPLLTEQIAIATYLDRETAKIDRLVEKVEAAILRLQEYRTALITAAVTGKIDVREAAA
jgi:restriction endonuclease S subunit